MNKVILDGRIMPNNDTQKNRYLYREGGDKTSVLIMTLMTSKNYAKPDENGKYVNTNNFFTVKCWGPKADFVNRNFGPGAAIVVEGSLEVEKGGDRPEGGKYPDRIVIYADNVFYPARQAAEGVDRGGVAANAASNVTAQASSSRGASFSGISTGKPF